jgi:translocation and assembly module TamB
MKLSRRTYFWGGLALLLVALGAGICFFSGPLLNDLLRPRLAALAAGRLSAEVEIGRLAWEKGALVVEGLRVDRPGRYRLAVPALRLEASVSGLLRRRLALLELNSPDLLLEPAPEPSAGGFPARSPLDFDRLTVRRGRVAYRHSTGIRQAREIFFDAEGGGPYRFSLSASLGEETAIPLRLAGRAEWRQGLAVSLETLEWDGQDLLAEPLAVSLPPGDGPAGGGRVHLAQLDRATVQRILDGLRLTAPLPEGWDFTLRDLAVRFALAESRLEIGLELAEGSLTRGALTVPLSGLTLEVAGSGNEWQGRGSCQLAGDNPAEGTFCSRAGMVEGRLQWTVAEPGRLKELLAGGPAPALYGGMRLTINVSGPVAAPRLQAEMTGFGADGKKADYLLDMARLRLQAELHREKDIWLGQARLFLSDLELAAAEGHAGRLSLRLHSVSWSRLRQVLGPRLRPAFLEHGTGLDGDLQLARGAKDSWTGTVRLAARELRLSGAVLQNATGRLRFTRSGDQGWAGSVIGEGKRVAADGLVLEKLTAASEWRYRKGRLTFAKTRAGGSLAGPGQATGKLALAGSGSWRKERWQARLSSLAFTDLELLSDDGLAGLAGGRVQAAGTAEGGPGRPLALSLNAELAVTDALWGAYYADLSSWPARMSLRAKIFPGSRSLQIEQLRLDQAKIGFLQGTGTVRADDLQLAGELSLPNLGGPLAELLRGALGESLPLVADAKLGGALRTTLSFQRHSGGWRLRGEALPERLALELPAARLSLSGVGGELPFELTSGTGAPTRAGEQRSGTLRFQAVRLGPVALAGDRIRIAASADRWLFPDPVRLETGGGSLTVDRLAAGRKEDGVFCDGYFTIAGIDLETLAGQLGGVPLKGRIDADLGRISYSGGALTTQGEALIDIFGGSLRVRNIRLDLSSLAYLQVFADLDFTAIDLFQLTQTFSFGVMNGIVDGHVHDLRLFGATPARFSALLESREEGRRNISVKALNNLSILSQGGLSAALSRGVYRFIDFYRYRKIGIVCDLEKDVFHLRGTARPGSDRYLVFGGVLPPKIDIIAPPSVVSFSEMLRRLKRIDRAQ